MNNELFLIGSATIGGEEVQTVNARELHVFLEVGKDFSTWIKDRIEKYGFVENVDYAKIDSPKSGNQKGGDRRSVEYHISLSMAKELAMVERNEKGKQARLYFIECEKRLKTVTAQQPQIPQNYVEALEAHLQEVKKNAVLTQKNLALEHQIEQDAPKVEVAERLFKGEGDHLIRNVAKAFGVRVMFLFDWMRGKRLISKRNEAYAEPVKRGLLRQVMTSYTGSDGCEKYSFTTHVTNKGVAYIFSKLKEEGYIAQEKQINLDFLKEA